MKSQKSEDSKAPEWNGSATDAAKWYDRIPPLPSTGSAAQTSKKQKGKPQPDLGLPFLPPQEVEPMRLRAEELLKQDVENFEQSANGEVGLPCLTCCTQK